MHTGKRIFLLIMVPALAVGPFTFFRTGLSAQKISGIKLDVEANLARLIEEEDTDGDKKITVDDACSSEDHGCDKQFRFRSRDGTSYEVSGTYYLSNLLQELKIAQDAGRDSVDLKRIFENPVQRISRSIREIYWNGLTRRIDGPNLKTILSDEKVSSTGVHYLYVPATDPDAFRYFSAIAHRMR